MPLAGVLRVPDVPPRLLLACGAVAVAALAFAYFGLGGAERLVAADTLVVVEQVRDEAAALRRRRTDAMPRPPAAPGPGDQAALVRQVQAVAARAGAQFIRLNPRPREDGALDLELAAPFPALLRFVAELELLGAVPRDLQLRPAEATEGSPDARARRTVTLVLDPPRRDPVSGPGGDAMLLAAGMGRLRDPFAPLVATRPRDLSAQHRLTGLTAAAGGGLATIDGTDYEAGDALGGMTVISMDENGVLLAAGPERYLIRFPDPPR